MKRAIVLIGLGLCVLFTNSALAGELEEKQLLLQNIRWEYSYCQERIKVLKAQAQIIQKQIAALQKEAKAAAMKEEAEAEVTKAKESEKEGE